MGYRPTQIGMQATFAPRDAKASLLRAFRDAGGDAEAAAKALSITRRTFDRLILRLGLEKHVQRIRVAARKSRAA